MHERFDYSFHIFLVVAQYGFFVNDKNQQITLDTSFIDNTSYNKLN